MTRTLKNRLRETLDKPNWRQRISKPDIIAVLDYIEILDDAITRLANLTLDNQVSKQKEE